MNKLEHFIILGDFNCEMKETIMKDFCETYNLRNLVTDPTCFKNPLNPSSINLILTNKYRSFQNTIIVETGLSDHHTMTVSVTESSLPKQFPNLVRYRNHKNFIRNNFRDELKHNFLSLKDDANFDTFETKFMNILNIHAPMKEKLIRANYSPFMNKTLSKAFMNRSRLKNRFLKNPNEENKLKYNKQRNYCVNLLRKVKRNYYSNLNIKNITDNKKFWNTVKPLFSEKSNSGKNITLIEGDTIISNDKKKLAETLNNSFSNAVKNLNIKGYKIDVVSSVKMDDIYNIVSKFRNHPSIIKIKEKVHTNIKFSFAVNTLNNIEGKIKEMNASKPTPINTIPSKILRDNSDIIPKYIFNFYKEGIKCCEFPHTMKMAEIIPSFKKGHRTKKENYRPVSILPSVSKIFEKSMYVEINQYE